MSICLQPLAAQILPQTEQLIATDANTIYVSSADELLAIATNNDTNNGYSGKTIVVADDITLTGSWTSIGTSSVPFVGTFDGGFHTIEISFSNNEFYGLFQYVGAGASVLNTYLNFANTDSDYYYGNQAALVYSAIGTSDNLASIRNCINRGEVHAYDGTYGRGGIVGEAQYVTIDSCANFGLIDDRYAGGIVGRWNNEVFVNNCYNFGDVSARADAYNPYGIGGGVVTNSYCIADIECTNDDFGSSPAAISTGTVNNCYFNGILTYGGTEIKVSNATTVTDGANLYNLAKTAGWDFENTWIYDDFHNINGYPQLRAFIEEISVDIDLNGGTYSGSTTISNEKYNTTCTLPSNITKAGYTFNGYIVTNGVGSVSGNTYTFGTANGTVQVQWKVTNYSITYDLDGGSMSGQKITYTIETETFNLPTPTKAKYVFLGWTGSNGTTPQTSVSIAKGTYGDLSYTANWAPDIVKINISVTVNNDREYIVYMLDSNGDVTRQFVVKDGTTLNFAIDAGTTFSLKVYETLYLKSTIDGTETRCAEYKNISSTTLDISIILSGANDVNNWLVV